MTSLGTSEIDGGSVSLTAAHEQQQQAPARQTKASISELRGLKPGARVCLMSDWSRRGIIESQGSRGWWAVRFADKSRNIRVTDLKLLPSDDASFEPSQAPLSTREKEASASESLKRGLSVTAFTEECAECPITLMAGTLGLAFASRATRRGAASSRQKLRASVS